MAVTRYIEGVRCIQVNFAENIRQLKILGSCPVTVVSRVTAIYRAVINRFDKQILSCTRPSGFSP